MAPIIYASFFYHGVIFCYNIELYLYPLQGSTCLGHIKFNNVSANALATKGVRASQDMILSLLSLSTESRGTLAATFT